MSDTQAAFTTENPEVEPVKVPVEGCCPECGRSELRRYPVLGEGGWWMAVKCQFCLASVERTRWNRLGWITLPEYDL